MSRAGGVLAPPRRGQRQLQRELYVWGKRGPPGIRRSSPHWQAPGRRVVAWACSGARGFWAGQTGPGVARAPGLVSLGYNQPFPCPLTPRGRNVTDRMCSEQSQSEALPPRTSRSPSPAHCLLPWLPGTCSVYWRSVTAHGTLAGAGRALVPFGAMEGHTDVPAGPRALGVPCWTLQSSSQPSLHQAGAEWGGPGGPGGALCRWHGSASI